MSDLQPVIIWLNAVLIALTICAVSSRAGRKIFVVGIFGCHDGLIILAAVSAVVFSIFQMVSTGLGLGNHLVDVDPMNMPQLKKLLLASNVFYFTCNWAIKHALLSFYSDVTRERAHRVSIYIMHVIAFGFGLSSVMADLFRCRPFNKAFHPELDGYCINLDIFYYYNSSMMLAIDIVLYAMPIVFTRKLMLRPTQKLGLNCLFALGGLVLAASAARIWSVHMLAVKLDFTFRFSIVMIFAVLENHLAILVACAPSIKTITLLIFPAFTSSLKRLTSRLTPTPSFPNWSIRSKSRASMPFGLTDLEVGETKGSIRRNSAISKDDELRLATGSPVSLKRPSLTYQNVSGRRASREFSRWFDGQERTWESTEDMGLVYVEHSFSIERMPRTPER